MTDSLTYHELTAEESDAAGIVRDEMNERESNDELREPPRDGVVVVVGKTLGSARKLTDAWPELSGARITSPLSAGGWGMRTRQVYLEYGLIDQSDAMLSYVRRLLRMHHRNMTRLGVDPVFRLLPEAGHGQPKVIGCADLLAGLARPTAS